MSSLSSCQQSCSSPSRLSHFSTLSWNHLTESTLYEEKWANLKTLIGDESLNSLSDLSAEQVKFLFKKLGVKGDEVFGMDGGLEDAYYEDGGEVGEEEDVWSEALTTITQLTELQEDAIDDHIDSCYDLCSESHPMVFSFDADIEGFPELDMWISAILRKGYELIEGSLKEIEEALQKEFEGGSDKSTGQDAVDLPYNFNDLHTTRESTYAETFRNLIKTHLPSPALQDSVAIFADEVHKNEELGLYYVGADSWSLSVLTLTSCAVESGLKFTHLDMGQRPHYASYTRGLPSIMLSTCGYDNLDLCLYDWDEDGNHPVECCKGAVFRAWPICESPMWTVEKLKEWVEEKGGKGRVEWTECEFKQDLGFLFSGYEERQREIYCGGEEEEEQKKKKKLSKKKVGGGTQKRRKELSTIDPDDPMLDGVARFWVPEVGWVAADPDDVGSDGFFVMSTFLLLVGGWYALKEGRGWLGRRGNRKYYPLDEEVEEEEEERGGGGGSGGVGNKNGGGGKKNPQAKKSKKKNNRSTSKSTDSKNIEEEERKRRETKEHERVKDEQFRKREEERQAQLRAQYELDQFVELKKKDRKAKKEEKVEAKKEEEVEVEVEVEDEVVEVEGGETVQVVQQQQQQHAQIRQQQYVQQQQQQQQQQIQQRQYVTSQQQIAQYNNRFNPRMAQNQPVGSNAYQGRGYHRNQHQNYSYQQQQQQQQQQRRLQLQRQQQQQQQAVQQQTQKKNAWEERKKQAQAQEQQQRQAQQQILPQAHQPQTPTGGVQTNFLPLQGSPLMQGHTLGFSSPSDSPAPSNLSSFSMNSPEPQRNNLFDAGSNPDEVLNVPSHWMLDTELGDEDNRVSGEEVGGSDTLWGSDLGRGGTGLPLPPGLSDLQSAPQQQQQREVAPWSAVNLGGLQGAMMEAEQAAASKFLDAGAEPRRVSGGEGEFAGFDELSNLLSDLRLMYLKNVLDQHEVDIDSLKLMSEDDLREMGIAKGPRVKLMKRVQSELFGLSVGLGGGDGKGGGGGSGGTKDTLSETISEMSGSS
ncbi:hypothetical protein TrLO_g9067 [Triparma laevis f. longispina]|uniref:SAM domain-containing protein n=1 Tax=Triparma laevis f. longispina TaxID=1714387 RepID=A0A9W7A2E3_9STRA|nr:hypothetical protein TrLO_g9067 [Triparma laevis f. longispina]